MKINEQSVKFIENLWKKTLDIGKNRWNLMKMQFMKTNEKHWIICENYNVIENQWTINENPCKINDRRSKLVRIHENQWKFINFNENKWKTICFLNYRNLENQWKSFRMHENQWKSKKVMPSNENLWKNDENHWQVSSWI